MTGFRARFYGAGPFTTIRLINEEPHPYKYFTKHNSLTKKQHVYDDEELEQHFDESETPFWGFLEFRRRREHHQRPPRESDRELRRRRVPQTLLELEKTRACLLGCGPGSFSPVKDVNEANMVADYAVAEYNKRSGANLKLEKVISCDYQVVGGFNYHLILATNEGFAGAGVYTRLWESYMDLTSFKEFPSSQTQPANA